ncbi:hypothetical protein [Chloroflexus sp.]|nr:hypothetical protein [Chloroflexus sp.]
MHGHRFVQVQAEIDEIGIAINLEPAIRFFINMLWRIGQIALNG